MLRALSKEFPAKYKDMLAAYYASFVGEEPKPDAGGKKPEEGGKEGGRKEGQAP